MHSITGSESLAAKAATAGPYKYYALLVLVLVGIVNAADRGILPILAERVKHDLNISDSQLAFLHGTAFMTLYTLLGIPAARLADSMSRTKLLAGGLAVWSCFTAVGAFAFRLETLATARLGVGVGEATANPTTHSLLCDYFPVRLRSRVIATYLCGLFIGAGLAAAVGGRLVTGWPEQCVHLGLCSMRSWQVAFLIMGLPGLLLAALVLNLREPVRGANEGVPVVPQSIGHWRAAWLDLLNVLPLAATVLLMREGDPGAVRRNLIGAAVLILIAAALVFVTGDVVQWVALCIGIYAIMSWCQRLARVDPVLAELTLRTPAFVYSVLGYSVLGAMIGAVHFWMFPYAIRNLGVDASRVGLILGPLTATGAIVGVLGGSVIADILRTRDPRGYLTWSIVVMILFSVALVAMMMSTTMTAYTISAVIFTVFSYGWSAAASSQAQDLVLPRVRATTSAIFALSITLATLALGPYAVGRLAEAIGSLGPALLGILAIGPIGGILLLMAARNVKADQASKWERAEGATA